MPKPLRPLLRDLRFRLEAAGFGALVALVRGLGVERASAFSSWCWRRLAPLNKRHARAAGQMRAAFPHLTGQEVAANLDVMWDNLGRTSVEAFHIDHLVSDLSRFEIGEDTLEAVRRAREVGAVFVSLHMGNWELASPLLDRLGLPVAGVYQALQNPHVETTASRFRAPFYRLGLFSKGHDTARQLLRIVGNGGTVTIMADLRDLTGIAVPFFGRPAPSTMFPALLARGRGVPLFAGVVMRTHGTRFAIRTVEVPVARAGDRDADIRETTAAIQRAFEDFIRLAPAQWMWGHRRYEK